MPTDLMARMLRNTSTADLYELVAAALTELHTRETVSDDPVGLSPNDIDIIAQYADIRWDLLQKRFVASFHDEGSATLAAEQTRAPRPGTTWGLEDHDCTDPECLAHWDPYPLARTDEELSLLMDAFIRGEMVDLMQTRDQIIADVRSRSHHG